MGHGRNECLRGDPSLHRNWPPDHQARRPSARTAPKDRPDATSEVVSQCGDHQRDRNSSQLPVFEQLRLVLFESPVTFCDQHLITGHEPHYRRLRRVRGRGHSGRRGSPTGRRPR